ncbi:MAG: YcaQ family DNA glycosylase [Flavobacteriales bacterium]|nr:YcaQ family DNA glycosylase [Flavobacteriales bacterium]
MPYSNLISQKEARKLSISSQGLDSSKMNPLKTIQQISYVQIDTISVTERAHNHVLYSRNPHFRKEDLIQLMSDKSIFEYWSHAAAYLPMQDFRFSLYRKEQYKTGDKHWFPRDKKVDKHVMDRIKAEGPLQSKDFETPKKSNGWYEWKPTKIALTNLFMDGSLMISNRKGFQKIFDLTERVLPKNANTSLPSTNEYCHHLISNATKMHGLVSLNEICYLRKGIKPIVKQILLQLIEDKEIIMIQIESSNTTYYTTNSLINQSLKSSKQLHILSPFDNLIIQRNRIKEIFNFNYQIECYVPEKKRKFGYYSLPILYGNEFVARLDAKADRQTKLFTVKGIWFETGFKPTDVFYKSFSLQLESFSKFCGCKKIKINNVSPNSFKKELNSFI